MATGSTEQRLHIFLRHVHIKHNERSRDPGKHRPGWFTHEACFANLFDTLSKSSCGHRVTVTIVYDGTEADLAEDFLASYTTVPRKYPVSIRLAEAGSNMNSWRITLALAHGTEMGDDDLVYFMENDYLHVDGWLDKVFAFDASNIQYDYLSLYDHNDKYLFDMYDGLRSKIAVAGGHHWRTTPSTCGTFLMPRRVFMEDAADWMREIADFYMFADLAERKHRVLYSPVPGLNTHCMEGYLSPTIDWASIAKAAL